MFGGFAGFGEEPATSGVTVATGDAQAQKQYPPTSIASSVNAIGNQSFARFGSHTSSFSATKAHPTAMSALDDDFSDSAPAQRRRNESSAGSPFYNASASKGASRSEGSEPPRKHGFSIQHDEDSSRLSLFSRLKSSTSSGGRQSSKVISSLPLGRRKLRESRMHISWPSGPIEVAKLDDFQKDFYCATDQASAKATKEIHKYLQSHNMVFHGDYEPVIFFDFSGLDPHFSNAMYDSQFTKKAGDCCLSTILKNHYEFSKPTCVQAASWPILIQGRDCIGIAETGSGKTHAFSIPALLHAAAQPPTSEAVPSPIVVVFAPARELASQIYMEIENLLDHFNSMLYRCYGDEIAYDGTKKTPLRPLYAAVSYGGKDWRDHYKKMMVEPLDILVTTPGIFGYFYGRNLINLSRVTYAVLDECDAILSSGFKAELDILLTNSASNRQTLLWSATWPSEVSEVAQSYLNENTVFLGIGNYRASVNKHVIQHIVVAKSIKQKNIYLIDLLKCIMDGTFDDSMEKLQGNGVFTSIATSIQDEYRAWCSSLKQQSNGQSPEASEASASVRIIVFVNKKISADEIHDELSKLYGGKSCIIHGDIPQIDRETALEKFKNDEGSILVATDAVARGVHIEGVTHVINYDIPKEHVSYVHRCGRTGRAGKFGHAISIFLPCTDRQMVDALAGYFKENNESATLPPEFLDHDADSNDANRISRRGPRMTKRDFKDQSGQPFANDDDDPFDG
ncbi:Superfamily II DNA and RNA helicase [Giardia duodenalis]|uniref:RNA helicase n=1 Tax=Giardia intestinalis TaxID=5741 RepID=V6TIM0_GIAIN|nr:Superfamily II DNA and RNA helicase [Giardia intestinalis]